MEDVRLARTPPVLTDFGVLRRARASGAFTTTHDEFWTAARTKLGDAAGTPAPIDVLLLHRSVPRDSYSPASELL